jgi:hypothetical protein
MPESQHATSDRAPAKRKTTYPRDHPTENPKPPKRTKAEIQHAAKAKKDAEQAKKAAAVGEKKKKLLDAEEKRKQGVQRIAAIEDAVQQQQKQLQSHSERPDIKTMQTYKEQIWRQNDLQIDSQLIANQEEMDDMDSEWEEMYTDPDPDPPDFPPESAVDTDSDGVRLGLSEHEGDEMDEPYNNEEDGSEEENESDNSEMYRNLKKPREKKKKVLRIGTFKLCYDADLFKPSRIRGYCGLRFKPTAKWLPQFMPDPIRGCSIKRKESQERTTKSSCVAQCGSI